MNNETFADEPQQQTATPVNLADVFKQCQYALDLAVWVHSEIYQAMMNIRPHEMNFTQEQRVDMALHFRECHKYLNDIATEARYQMEYLEKICCYVWAKDPTNEGEPIRTELCTATPDTNVCASIPTLKKDPEGYNKLMDYLGIDPILRDRGKFLSELGEEHTEVVQVSWPGFVALCTRLKAAGHPLPDGIDVDKSFQIPKLRLRKKKGVQLTTNTSTKEITEKTYSDD